MESVEPRRHQSHAGERRGTVGLHLPATEQQEQSREAGRGLLSGVCALGLRGERLWESGT